jgi:hypothetical protein
MKALSASQRVTHDKYGLGVVSEVDAEYTVIEFDEHGRKKFLTRLVTLQPSEEPPPKRRRARKKKTTTKKATTKKATTKKATTKKATTKKATTKKATTKKTTTKAKAGDKTKEKAKK